MGPPSSRPRGNYRGNSRNRGEQDNRTLDDILDGPCPTHPKGNHSLRRCFTFQESIKRGDVFNSRQDQKQDKESDPKKGEAAEKDNQGLPRVRDEVNVIFGGHNSQESKREQKVNERRIMA